MAVIYGADLFCGAGGTSSGLLLAAQSLGRPVDLLAVNHWDTAIDTHTRNHPQVRHLCESLDGVDPRKVIPGGRLHILCASPECTHHSRARGGRPCSDQSRASAWHVTRWAEALRVDGILVENVPEFMEWGPLTKKGRPNKRLKGRLFQSWLACLESMGYKVEFRVVCCADYGDATTRQRLLVMARRGKVVWPSKTHGPGTERPHRSARGIIDWNLKGPPISQRKRPLSPNTMKRILAGMRKFGGQAFTMQIDQTGGGLGCLRPVSSPIGTIVTKQNMAVIEPFLVELRGTSDEQIESSAKSLDDPVGTITAGGRHHCLIEPFVLGQQTGSAPRSVTKPLPTIAGAGAIALVEPFLIKYYGTGAAVSVDAPLDTVTTKARFGLVDPDGGTTVWDARFRMLEPHELAAAMGFRDGYDFRGTKEDQVKQIGNAVPVHTAAAHCRALLS